MNKIRLYVVMLLAMFLIPQCFGQSDPNTPSDPNTVGGPFEMYVSDVSLSLSNKGINYTATAAVTVHDQGNIPIQGAIVIGDWYFNGSGIQTGASGVTDGNGQANIILPKNKASTGDIFKFVVTGVVLEGHTYVWQGDDEGQIILP